MALTRGFKKFAASVGVVAAIAGGYMYAARNGFVPGKDAVNLILPKKVELSGAAPLSNITNVPMLPLPSNSVLGSGEEYRMDQMGWASQHGLNYSNGGPTTTKGSGMANEGITNFRIIREDNCDKQVGDLVAFGAAWKQNGGNPKKGVQFISFMLDGSPSYMKGLKDALAPYGLHPVIIGSFGKSDGEDQFLGPEDWKKSPKKMMGKTVCGVLYDGDMNIAIKYAGDNDVRINPDPKTYDPDALNIIAAEDYLKAADMLNQGYTEEREVVRNGVRTGAKKKVGIDSVVTWFPGDERIASGKGNLVSLASTKEYYWQMPEAFITIKEWADANPEAIKKILKAGLKGGEQVKVHDKALYRACEISAKIYGAAGSAKEKDPAFWYKGFKRTEAKSGLFIGGSMNFSLADNLTVFGITNHDGGPAASSYNTFGTKMAEYWPAKMSSFPKAEEVFYTKFIEQLAAEGGVNQDLAQKPVYDNAPIRNTISSTTKSINFDSGRASLRGDAFPVLKKLHDEINVTGLSVTIIGHTDAAGSKDANMKLSEARAIAVRDYFISKGMPAERFRIESYGDTQPVDPSNTPTAYAKNRRVVIELGSK